MFSERVYEFGASTLRLEFDDILESTSEVRVSCVDQMLTMGGGAWRAIAWDEGSALVSERLHRGDIVILSVLVRADDPEGSRFNALQRLPSSGRAISLGSDEDGAYVDVVTGIRKVILNPAQLPR